MGKLKLFIVLAFFIHSFSGISQEQLGIRMDNYTGMDQAWINPAFVASSPLTFDIHLVGLGLYVEQNYGFIHNTSLLDMKNKTDFVSAFDLEGKSVPKNALVGDVYDTPNKKYLKFSGTLTGPSIMFKIAEQHSVGLFTNMRSALTASKIPAVLGYYAYDQKAYQEGFTVTPFKGAGSIWNETGIHYGLEIEKSNGTIAFGANLKYNSFLESGFFGLQNEMTYTKISPDSVSINYPAIEFAITTGNINKFGYDSNTKEPIMGTPSVDFYGHGLSADLGASIQIEDRDIEGYRWRAGISVLDFGVANIKQKAEFHTSDPIPNELTIDFEDLKTAKTVDELEKKISQLALGDPKASLKATSFKMGLPSAVSVQGDYQFIQNLYVGGTIVQPFGLARYNLTRAAVLAVAPRFENRYFSLTTPVVLRDWKSVRMGLAGRLGFVSFGTDNLGSFIRKKDFTGTDFYFAIRLNAVNLPNFLSGGGHKRSKKSKLGCYGF